MKKKNNVRPTGAKRKGSVEASDASAIIQRVREALTDAVEQCKAENPGVDVDAILSEQMELLPALRLISKSEVDKFVAYAKGQGTNMSFGAMEMGILAAGRKDMQDGLAEIANSMEFDSQDCTECGEGLDNRGRSKKKF